MFLRPTSSSEAPALLARLREATAESHRHLESLTRLDQSPIGRDDLGRFLLAMRCYLSTVEPALERFPEAWVPFEPSLVDRLDHDLEQLGLGPRTTETDDPTVPGTTDQAWGIAYVLEGSRLGGKMLARGLLASDPAFSTRYLYQPQDDSRWLEFRRRLEESRPDTAGTVAAARGAFDDIADQVRHQHSKRRQTR